MFSHKAQHQLAYGSEGDTERDPESSPDRFSFLSQLVEDQGKPSSYEHQRQGETVHGAGQLAVSFRQVVRDSQSSKVVLD